MPACIIPLLAKPSFLASLLSFLPLSCMGAPNREIVNKNLLVTSLAMSCSKNINNDIEDVNMGPPRGRSNNSSINSSRESYVVSKALTNVYVTYMEIQSEDLNWANQADTEIFHIPVSSQAGEESNNQVLVLWNALTLTFFFLFYLFFLILYFFSLNFFFFLVTMKRHVTSQSHDMSHDVTS